MCRLALVIDSCYRNIDLVGSCVKALSAKVFDEPHCDQIEVCVVEAVTNCIRHSYGGAGGYPVRITCQQEPDRIVIDIEDFGLAMAPHVLENQSTAFEFDLDDTEHLPESGLGLAVIKSWMDEVSYRSLDGANHLLLVKHKPVPDHDAIQAHP